MKIYINVQIAKKLTTKNTFYYYTWQKNVARNDYMNVFVGRNLNENIILAVTELPAKLLNKLKLKQFNLTKERSNILYRTKFINFTSNTVQICIIIYYTLYYNLPL